MLKAPTEPNAIIKIGRPLCKKPLGSPIVACHNMIITKCGTKDMRQEHTGWTMTHLKHLDNASIAWLDIIPFCNERKSIVVSYKRI